MCRGRTKALVDRDHFDRRCLAQGIDELEHLLRLGPHAAFLVQWKADNDADRVLLLDAIRTGRRPGDIILLQGEDVPRVISTKLSPHQIDMREVLALAQFRGTLPASLVAIGVEPEFVDVQHGLSSVVQPTLDPVVALAIDRLRMWGVTCVVSPVAVG